MKFNKWTVGLAAAGIVTLPSLAQAAAPSMVQTLTENMTMSGYVDTSAQWNPGTGNNWVAPVSFQSANKADGFNLNVVDLALDKPLDETPWAAGYHVELWFGPDANNLASQSTFGSSGSGPNDDTAAKGDFAIRQAYVTLRTPIGNGIDWKIGVFDTIIGYESTSGPNNPNYTRSYGYTIEPTTHTGLLGTYKFCDAVSLSAGVANTVGPSINDRAFDTKPEEHKTSMASITLTAPQNWGWLAGSSMVVGFVNGFSSSFGDSQTSIYAGATLSTPVTGLKVGLSWDYLSLHNAGPGNPNDDRDFAVGAYASYQATEKLSVHVRGEYWKDEIGLDGDYPENFYGVTLTAQYDLWKNVLSRVEFRWDHSETSTWFGRPDGDKRNAYMLAANVVYKF